ncbi:MAG: general secretion pathway protein GspB [bacterium]|nr:general secretion pathway protein GspB [bacterium]
MSSILKALKKIEENSPSPESHPSLPKPRDTNQLIDSIIKNRRRRRRFIYISLALLLIAGTTAFLFNQRQMLMTKVLSVMSSKPPTAEEASDTDRAGVYKAKVPTSSTKPVRKPPSPTRQPRTSIKTPMPDDSDKKLQATTRSSNRRPISESPPPPNSPRSRTLHAGPNSKIKKPLKKTSTSPGLQSVKSPAAGKKARPIAPVTRAKQPAQTRTQATYRPIENDKLKLQALAWSDAAARRMAVINGRIVREGDSVDGYQVYKIREEDVIVNESGKSWRLEFGLQQ